MNLETRQLFEMSEQITNYNLTFTAASLRPELARIVAEIHLENGSYWEVTKKKVLADNSLQARTSASAVRMEREFRQRLQRLTPRQLELLTTAPTESRMAVAWLAAMKHSAFIFEFASEVLRTKLESHDAVFRHSDYENFYQTKSMEHPELVSLQPATQTKVQRVLKTMLREVGILDQGTQNGSLRRPYVEQDVIDAIIADDRRWLAGFLVPDYEIAIL